MLLSLYSFLWLSFLLTSSGWFVTALCGSISVRGLVNNNNWPNGHLFYVDGDLMMRRGMLPIIMLPDGDLCIVLHLVPFLIFTIWGSVHFEETVEGWRNQLRMKTSTTKLPELHLATKHLPCHSELHHSRGAPIAPVVLPLHGTVVGRDYLHEPSPGSVPGSLARQR